MLKTQLIQLLEWGCSINFQPCPVDDLYVFSYGEVFDKLGLTIFLKNNILYIDDLGRQYKTTTRISPLVYSNLTIGLYCAPSSLTTNTKLSEYIIDIIVRSNVGEYYNLR